MRSPTWVQSLVKAEFGTSSVDWTVDQIVRHPGGYNVKIISGYFLDPIYGRVSNHWSWRRVLKGGKLGPIKSGYGW